MPQVLYITGQSVRFYQSSSSDVELQGRFSCNEAGYADLRTMLSTTNAEPTAALVDLIEEQFREETLPHTLGRDRSRLHARHAGKLFRLTPFRHHRLVGRQKQGRRDDRVRFSALTNRDNIQPLLDMLDEAGIPLSGIHSLPILTRRLLKPLGARTGAVLVITGQPDGGLRETFVRDGQVRFSRLAPVNETSAEDYCSLVNGEAEKTQRYLHTLRLLGRDEVLEVYVLTDTSRVDAFQGKQRDTASLNFHPLRLAQVAQQCGYKNHPETPSSDALFTYLLARHPIRNHYAQPAHLHRLKTWQISLGLRVASWLIAVGSVTLAGMNGVDGVLIDREKQQITLAAAKITSQHQRVTDQLPVEPAKALAMREAIHFADLIQERSVDLDHLFRLTGTAFARQTNLVMKKIHWFVTPYTQADSISDLSNDNADSVETAKYLVCTIIGRLRHFNGSYRQAHDQVERLSAWMNVQPGVVETVIVRKPLDTSAKSDLQGGIAKQGEEEQADFELRVVMELENESV